MRWKVLGVVGLVALAFGAGALTATHGDAAELPVVSLVTPDPTWQKALDGARGTVEGDRLRASALDAIANAPSEAVRADAVDMLGFVGDEADVPVLIELVD